MPSCFPVAVVVLCFHFSVHRLLLARLNFHMRLPGPIAYHAQQTHGDQSLHKDRTWALSAIRNADCFAWIMQLRRHMIRDRNQVIRSVDLVLDWCSPEKQADSFVSMPIDQSRVELYGEPSTTAEPCRPSISFGFVLSEGYYLDNVEHQDNQK